MAPVSATDAAPHVPLSQDFGSGCRCCSPRGDFTRLLGRLWQEHGGEAAEGAERVTHLLVETTGAAEPLVVAKLFFADAFVAERFCLDAIVAVVDSAAPPPSPTDGAAPPWAAAAVSQVAAASVLCVNVRAPATPPATPPPDARAAHEQPAPALPLSASVGVGVDASVDLATGAASAATDLASVLLDAASEFATVTLVGSSGVVDGVRDLLPSITTFNARATNDALGRLGTGLTTVSSGAGVLLGAAGDFSVTTVERAGRLSECALLAAATLTGTLLDDTAALPGHVGGLYVEAAKVSLGLASNVLEAATLGFHASHDYVAQLLNGAAAPGAPQIAACFTPGEPLADAGAALWAAIASEAGAFSVDAAVALDADFLAPAEANDDVAPLLQAGGHAARVTCVCLAESGTPLVEIKLRAWLAGLAATGAVQRAKGAVRVRDGAGAIRELLVDGVGGALSIRTWHASHEHDDCSGPLCGDENCTLEEHAGDPCASKIFLVVAPGQQPAQLKRAFRECFVPNGFAWAADVEIDFPPATPASTPIGIERTLHNGPKVRAAGPLLLALRHLLTALCTQVVLWRVGHAPPRYYACEAECPHAGGPLVEGSVLDMEDAATCVCLRNPHADVPALTLSLRARHSTTMGPLLSCPWHLFTWDLASGAPVSALGCGAMKTYAVAVILGSLYVNTQSNQPVSPADDADATLRRRPSWRT